MNNTEKVIIRKTSIVGGRIQLLVALISLSQQEGLKTNGKYVRMEDHEVLVKKIQFA